MQVAWVWNAFDHMDLKRKSKEDGKCRGATGNMACSAIYLTPVANDWLHGNALQLTPDGNILYSSRHQDWVIKIDYANGTGSGNILWRMGLDGDFSIQSSDPNPWFSHQHDPNFESNGNVLLVFDDGNIREAADPTAHSRGQVLQVDEVDKIVRPTLNADLGVYSGALGSAQLLPDGNFHFDAGFLLSTSASGSPIYNGQSLEVNLSDQVVFGIQFGTLEYRSFRIPNLYTAPEDALVASVDRSSRR